MNTANKKLNPIIWSIILPFLLLFFIAFVQGYFPFGSSSPLTIDLGQQYVDFYAYYRDTLLSGDWTRFLYSFEKSLGGEMIGTWSYYLMSPFNLILLLFPKSWLPFSVYLLMTIKISFASGSFFYFLSHQSHSEKKDNAFPFLILALSLSYAFMGYVSANLFNIMWLDALAFLPLIVLGMKRFINDHSSKLYILSYALLIISNYYMAYMVGLFLILEFFYSETERIDKKKLNFKQTIKDIFKKGSQFAFNTFVSVGLSAFLWLPTLYSLSVSKGTFDRPKIEWTLDYPFRDLLSKFIIGAYNFDQIPDGLPNVFTGSLAFFGVGLFLLNRQTSIKKRLVSLLILLFLILSMNLKGLNLIFHGLQYPIWYPYRFSYVFSFFILELAYEGLSSSKKGSYKPIMLYGIGVLSFIYVGLHLKDYDYLTFSKWSLSLIFFTFIAFLLFLTFRQVRFHYLSLLLLALSFTEMGANTILNVTAIDYLSYDDFQKNLSLTSPVIDQYRPTENEFFRLTKTYQRTKNDAMQLNYPDLNHFNSTIEKSLITLYQNLGFATNAGFVSASGGTLFTDQLFALRYLLSPNTRVPFYQYKQVGELNATSRRDWEEEYPVIQREGPIKIQEIPSYSSIGFIVPKSWENLSLNKDPIALQNAMMASYLPKNSDPVLTVANYSQMELVNLTAEKENEISTTFFKKDKNKEAYIHLHFIPATDDPYYLVLPSDFNSDEVALDLNGRPMDFETTFDSPQILNVANNQQGKDLVLTLRLKKDSLRLDSLNLYRFSRDLFDQVKIKQNALPLQVTYWNSHQLEGKITTLKKNEILALSFPYSKGWHLKVDDKKENLHPLLGGGFSFIKLSTSGPHQIDLIYWPPYLDLGLLISILTSFLFFTWLPLKGIFLKRRKK